MYTFTPLSPSHCQDYYSDHYDQYNYRSKRYHRDCTSSRVLEFGLSGVRDEAGLVHGLAHFAENHNHLFHLLLVHGIFFII